MTEPTRVTDLPEKLRAWEPPYTPMGEVSPFWSGTCNGKAIAADELEAALKADPVVRVADLEAALREIDRAVERATRSLFGDGWESGLGFAHDLITDITEVVGAATAKEDTGA